MYQHTSKARVIPLALIAVLLTTVLAPLASYAGSEGSRNTAIGLAGAAAYLLIKGKTVPGVVAAAGAGYAYQQSQKKREEERARDRYWDYRDRDRRDYRYDNRYDGRYDNRYGRGPSTYTKHDCDRRHEPRGNAYGYYKKHHDRDRHDRACGRR